MKKSRSKTKRPYLNQKIDLYFDENFPKEVVEELKSDKGWKDRCRVHSVYDFNNEKRDDTFQFGFCKSKGFTLVTLDDDFLDDKAYPYNGFPGIIRVVAPGNDLDRIKICVDTILSFLIHIPRPKRFLINTKLKVSIEGGMVRGTDVLTGEVKTYTLVPGETTIGEVRKFFHYFQFDREVRK